MGPPSIKYTLFAIFSVVDVVRAAETCLSQPQLFGVIFGSVAAAFLISCAIAVLLWVCLRKNGEGKETEEKSAYANDACDVEDKGIDAPRQNNKDKMTMIDSFKLRRKVEDVGTQKAYSMEFINEVDAKVGVHLVGEDIGGLGFNIQGNMNEGIFVKNLVSKGIAEQCGNILIGDRIKSLTINFENMVYEDAVTLLSYASPYKVKLELERKLADNASTDDSDEEKEMRYHPLFRSNTLTHVHFNPLGSVSTSPKPQRCSSADSKQKHALPKKDQPQLAEPDSTICDETSAHTGRDADASQMESSDYGSDGTSDCRESTASDGTQRTISDRIEITDIIFDKITSPTPPPHRKPEMCTELPPKPRKVVSRSPSPKVTHKPPPSPKVSRATSPQKQVPLVEDSTQTPRQKIETHTTQTDPVVKQEPPVPPPVSSIPSRKSEWESEKETQTSKPPTPTKALTPPAPVHAPAPAPAPEPVEPVTTTVLEPVKGPEITEARISRIPKRADSIKTPVVERKLPALPKSVAQRSHSADKNENVWSRLYQEKKGQLRKTRDVSSPPTQHRTSGIPSPSKSPVKPATNEEKYGTLNRERRDRLAANDAELERQRDELRQLGIL